MTFEPCELSPSVSPFPLFCASLLGWYCFRVALVFVLVSRFGRFLVVGFACGPFLYLGSLPYQTVAASVACIYVLLSLSPKVIIFQHFLSATRLVKYADRLQGSWPDVKGRSETRIQRASRSRADSASLVGC